MRSIFAEGLGAPEGPVARPDGTLYLTRTAADRRCITQVGQDGQRRVLMTTGGRPNGPAVDGDDHLWIAEAGLRALLCVAPDGREILRVEGHDDRRCRFPNDLAFDPDGHLYMTDSGMALVDFLDGQSFVDNYENLDWDGRVYEIDLRNGVVLRGIRFANGLGFDAAGVLYTNASFTREIYRDDLHRTGQSRRELFGNILQPDDQDGFKGPDGMAFGTDGRLDCTVSGQADVTVLDPGGSVAARLLLAGPNPRIARSRPVARRCWPPRRMPTVSKRPAFPTTALNCTRRRSALGSDSRSGGETRRWSVVMSWRVLLSQR